MKLNNLPQRRAQRRSLRKRMTPAEAYLWSLLKNSQLEGRKFRRQHSFNGYILDFYCPSEKLGVELDGDFHFDQRAMDYDHNRTMFLKYFGIRIIRFENALVFEATEWVLDCIRGSFGSKEQSGAWIDE